jgi:hypothetical protein
MDKLSRLIKYQTLHVPAKASQADHVCNTDRTIYSEGKGKKELNDF